MDPNWELRNCCQRDQVVFLACIGAYTVGILVLWRTFLITPFKLITVFLHEASHAVACILTCGKVEGMQVHGNEGGVTQTRGGAYWLILPAGYLGSSFWGMAFILASTNLLASRIAAGGLIAALFIVLFIAKNWTLRGLCIGFIVFIAVVWVLQELTPVRILRYIILFMGVMNSLFSVYDIYDDLISRRVNTSDAEKFAELCPCPCNGVGWGVIWYVFYEGNDILHFPMCSNISWACNLILRLRTKTVLNMLHKWGDSKFILAFFRCIYRVKFVYSCIFILGRHAPFTHILTWPHSLPSGAVHLMGDLLNCSRILTYTFQCRLWLIL